MKLIGTVHLDFNGRSRLEKLLNIVQPKRISVELPSDRSAEWFYNDWMKRQEGQMEKLCQKKVSDGVFLLIRDVIQNAGYELTSAVEYARKTGAEIFMVDHPNVQDELKSKIDLVDGALIYLDPLTRESHASLRKSAVNLFDKLYYDVISFELSFGIDKLMKLDSATGIRLTQELQTLREAHMAEQIRKTKPDVHIGGMGHMFENHANHTRSSNPLYVLLNDIVTERIKLMDVDQL